MTSKWLVDGLDEQIVTRVADTMFALSSPSRVQILGCLAEGARTVKELTEALRMEQSAVSHQLRVLRDHLLVRVVERAGRTRVYGLHDEHVAELLEAAVLHVEARAGSTARPVQRRGGAASGG